MLVIEKTWRSQWRDVQRRNEGTLAMRTHALLSSYPLYFFGGMLNKKLLVWFCPVSLAVGLVQTMKMQNN